MIKLYVCLSLLAVLVVGTQIKLSYDREICNKILIHTNYKLVCWHVPINYKEILASKEYVKPIYE